MQETVSARHAILPARDVRHDAQLTVRKTRCDGVNPVCGVCKEKGAVCEYNEEDRRK